MNVRALVTTLGFVAMVFACDRRAKPNVGGDPVRGREYLETRGCGACHTIPGVRGARGKVAAPLDGFALRTFFAGDLPNTQQNLVDWVMHPRRLRPKTAMPDLGIETAEARDITAYLYTLDGT